MDNKRYDFNKKYFMTDEESNKYYDALKEIMSDQLCMAFFIDHHESLAKLGINSAQELKDYCPNTK